MGEDEVTAGKAAGGEEGEALCRYCFEGREEGELISPCNCAGGQKYVHVGCLRRWQRRVLVSQPTHPAFYQDDVRHLRCNVCTGAFHCAPPTRRELMESFTGLELAALIEPACIIASHPSFAAHLRQQLAGTPEVLWEVAGYRHWIDGVYLITDVRPDDGLVSVPIQEQDTLDSVRARLDDRLSMQINRSRLRVVADGALEGVTPDEALPSALAALTAPTRLVFAPLEPASCSDDHITAVNLSRPITDHSATPNPGAVQTAVSRAKASSSHPPGVEKVALTHFRGGPCQPGEISCCVVIGGDDGCGWKVVEELQEAIELAASRAEPVGDGAVRGGQQVRLHGLQTAASLNGELGIALRYEEGSGRWLVRLRDGEGKKVKVGNLEPVGEGHGSVYVFWGDAQWSRAQLLGEIARGSWGLCRAGISELIAPPEERYRGLTGRLAYAPLTEMSDDYIRNAQGEMEAIRAEVQLAASGQQPALPPPPPPGSPPAHPVSTSSGSRAEQSDDSVSEGEGDGGRGDDAVGGADEGHRGSDGGGGDCGDN